MDNTKVAKPLNWLTTLGISTTQPNGSLNSYVDNKIAGDQFVVFEPLDWSQYPPSLGLATTLKSYTDKKMDVYIDALTDGGNDYFKRRNDSINTSGNRIGTQKIDFLRTSSNQAFGADQCADWRIGKYSTYGFDIYRKASGSLGSRCLYMMFNGVTLPIFLVDVVFMVVIGPLYTIDDDTCVLDQYLMHKVHRHRDCSQVLSHSGV